MKTFDVIVLTAASETQAQVYRQQLTERERRGQLAPGVIWRVIADPDGRRVGSGGSTLMVLTELASSLFSRGETLAERFQGRRVLIAHSGGDARRLPAYAALGKIFMPMPCDIVPSGQPAWNRYPASLFDLLVQTLGKIPAADEGQVIICSGDVLLTFDAARTDLQTPSGITGLGFAAPPSVGEQHGVYLTPNPSIGGPVTNFLQKPTRDEMVKQHAVDPTGRILVDSGVLCLSPAAVETLLSAAGIEARKRGVKIGAGLHSAILNGQVGTVDLYQEIMLALPTEISRSGYLESIAAVHQNSVARRVLGRFYDKIRAAKLPFNVVAVPDGEFFHVGTTRDLLNKFTAPSRTARLFAFKNGHRTDDDLDEVTSHRLREHTGPTIFNTTGNLDVLDIKGRAYIEGCVLDQEIPARPLVLEGNNVLIGWGSANAESQAFDLHFPVGIGLVCLPVRPLHQDAVGDALCVPVLFGVDDDNKRTLDSGRCLFLNHSIRRLIDAGIGAEMLWNEEDEKSTWFARLWLTGDHKWKAMQLLRDIMSDGAADAASELLQVWGDQPRYSLAELIKAVDSQKLFEYRHEISRIMDCRRILDELLEHDDFPAAEALKRISLCVPDSALSSGKAVSSLQRLMAQLARRFPNPDQLPPLTRTRLFRVAALIAELAESEFHSAPASAPAQNDLRMSESYAIATRFADFPVKRAADFNSAAFHLIAKAVEDVIDLPTAPRPAAILHDQTVWVTAPARIDFAGGWTDTPPICFEQGGAVLNAAVTLNRQYPLQVIAKLNDERCIRLTSIDLGRQEIYRDLTPFLQTIKLDHWSGLAKEALILAGIVPDPHTMAPQDAAKGDKLFVDWLETLGGGLDLTLFSGLPKGSGMGTSSILGAAIISCLSRVNGGEMIQTDLIARTTLLEQRMTSGGGWQDQIGGIVGGVKFITTQPGIEQKPTLQWTSIGGSGPEANEVHRRMLLYFTGQKRLAKDILHNVLSRYLAREPEVMATIARLKRGAAAAKHALEVNDIRTFGDCLAEYWELKKALDPSSTNDNIETIIARVRPYLAACNVCGAGGGGFILMLARDEAATLHIRRALQETPPNQHARFFDFAIDSHGLSVTVL